VGQLLRFVIFTMIIVGDRVFNRSNGILVQLLKLTLLLCAFTGMAASLDLGELIPLTEVDVHGFFYDSLGKVIITQRWENSDFAVPIMGTYKFSLDPNAVVSGLRMRIGDKSWTGRVKANTTAHTEYRSATNQGIKSSLLEKLSENEYQMHVGPIEPGQATEIVIQFLCRAVVRQDGAYQFVLPTNIAQKYIGVPSNNNGDNEYASRMAGTPYVNRPNYRFNVDITWTAGSALREILSTTNAITTKVLTARSAQVHCTTAPHHGDFTLLVKTDNQIGAYSYTNKVDGHTILYIHTQVPDENALGPFTGVSRRISFVVDRSWSMGIYKMQSAIDAITKLLSMVPTDGSTLVNVISFGKRYEAMFSHAVPATTDQIISMKHKVESFTASLGGTELLDCLRDVVNDKTNTWDILQEPMEGNEFIEHIVILVTDGQVANFGSITDMIESHQRMQKYQPVRVITIGVGVDTDRKVVQHIADKTFGICKVLADEKDITEAMRDIMRSINRQYYTDLHVVGSYESTQGSNVVYPGHPVDIFLRVSSSEYSTITQKGINLMAWDPSLSVNKQWHIPVGRVVSSINILEQLYAHHVIEQLGKQIDEDAYSYAEKRFRGENVEVLKNKIVDTSVAHGIMSAFTAYVIVSDEVVQDFDEWTLIRVEVPQHEGMSLQQIDKRKQKRIPSMLLESARATTNSEPMLGPTAGPSAQPATFLSDSAGTLLSAGPVFLRSDQQTPTYQADPRSSSHPIIQPTVQPSRTPGACPTAGPTQTRAGTTAESSESTILTGMTVSCNGLPVSDCVSADGKGLAVTGGGAVTPGNFAGNTRVLDTYSGLITHERPEATASLMIADRAPPTVTARPTAPPRDNPTGAPSAYPTATPTADPTAAPSAYPTVTPSAYPTAAPSAYPTATPSAAPTAAPSAFPTAIPTASPTAAPSADPVATPADTAALSAASLKPSGLPAESANELRPILECTNNWGNGTCNSVFGYDNLGSQALFVPVEQASNFFTPSPVDRGQPYIYYPGRMKNAFSVSYSCEDGLSWTLDNHVVTASNLTTCS
jgi:hypothetical protein